MAKSFTALTEALPTVIKNTHFNFTLAGWPAAVTAIALCCTAFGLYALYVTHPESPSA